MRAMRIVFGTAGALLAGAVVLIGISVSAPVASAKVLVNSSECTANRTAGTITYVSPFGYDASTGIIDVAAAQKLGYFGDLCLNVHLIWNSQDATSLVSSGTATTTNVGSASDFLVAVSTGSDITAVATYGDTSDYCIIARPGIKSLKGLEGATLGYHFVQEAPDLELLTASGVKLSEVKMVDTSDYNPNQIVDGTLDALDCYQSNEPIELQQEGKKFTEFTPQQAGVTSTYNVEFFNTRFLDHHYQAAKDWMRADLHAVSYCESHKSQCVEIEGEYAKQGGSEFSPKLESAVWNLESKLSKTHTLPGKGIGVESYKEWEPEDREVVKFKLTSGPLPSLSKVENVKMVESLYDGSTLVWP